MAKGTTNPSEFCQFRIQNELRKFNWEISLLGMTLTRDPNDIHHLTATIPGPYSSAYDGGLFHIDIMLPDNYPFSAPKVKFTTKVWHPNISSRTGAIRRDLLKNNWSPAISLRGILICLQALLSTPEPEYPKDAFVAKQYLADHAAFTATARHWTEDFATVSSALYNRKVQKLTEMGFPEALVKNTLEAAGGDEFVALKRLCSLYKRSWKKQMSRKDLKSMKLNALLLMLRKLFQTTES